MCRPDDYPPFTDAEIAAIAAIDTEPDDDPHAQHDRDCQVAAEREGARA